MCCHQGKCFMCISVETGCLVLAIIKAVITGSLLLTSIILACLCVPFYIVGPIGLASVVAFTFTVLLCNGICTRQSGQVKAYFIYGVVSVVLEVLASYIAMCAAYYTSDMKISSLGLIFSVLHALFLVMVHNTYYKLFEANASPLVLV